MKIINLSQMQRLCCVGPQWLYGGNLRLVASFAVRAAAWPPCPRVAVLYRRAAVAPEFSSRAGEASISPEISIAFQIGITEKKITISTLSVSEGSFHSKLTYGYQIECLTRWRAL